MRRMTAYLAGEAGITQFLDIGTGLPTSPNMHEIAQRIAPGSRVVYVDNDPIVLAHARALLTSTAEGACAYISADARDPETILADPRLRGTLDLSKPVALMLFGIMHFFPDSDDPQAVVARFMQALPAGSYLAIQHPTTDFDPSRPVPRAPTAVRGSRSSTGAGPSSPASSTGSSSLIPGSRPWPRGTPSWSPARSLACPSRACPSRARTPPSQGSPRPRPSGQRRLASKDAARAAPSVATGR